MTDKIVLIVFFVVMGALTLYLSGFFGKNELEKKDKGKKK